MAGNKILCEMRRRSVVRPFVSIGFAPSNGCRACHDFTNVPRRSCNGPGERHGLVREWKWPVHYRYP